ncbi:hypothetical protein JTB14_030758 [Gonioctena quinquepunctata]|nr:hypothetical protein JTB14_030758 [Gonioctena quinquepunctata]
MTTNNRENIQVDKITKNFKMKNKDKKRIQRKYGISRSNRLRKYSTNYNKTHERSCQKYGTNHGYGKCPAHGQQYSKYGNMSHFDGMCRIKSGSDDSNFNRNKKTKLGWVVSGHLNVENYDTQISCNIAISNDELYEQLQAFWKIEEVITKNHYTLEELECEEHYTKTFRRDDQGRSEVTLPAKDELNQLGESEKAAINRFSSIGKRFIRDSEYKKAYVNFMNEYIQYDGSRSKQ